MTCAPTLTTDRLTLRGHRMSDLDPFWDFYQSPRAQYMSVPENRADLWYGLVSEVGSWALQGQGCWAIDTTDGQFIGQVGITQPPHYPEPELGWLLFDGHEGKGYAHEAAQTVLTWGWAHLSHPTLVSYVGTANTRSRALAERLGAVPDADAQGLNTTDIVYRHPRQQ